MNKAESGTNNTSPDPNNPWASVQSKQGTYWKELAERTREMREKQREIEESKSKGKQPASEAFAQFSNARQTYQEDMRQRTAAMRAEQAEKEQQKSKGPQGPSEAFIEFSRKRDAFIRERDGMDYTEDSDIPPADNTPAPDDTPIPDDTPMDDAPTPTDILTPDGTPTLDDVPVPDIAPAHNDIPTTDRMTASDKAPTTDTDDVPDIPSDTSATPNNEDVNHENADQTKHENTDKLKHEDAQKQKLEHEAKIAAQNEKMTKLKNVNEKLDELNARLLQNRMARYNKVTSGMQAVQAALDNQPQPSDDTDSNQEKTSQTEHENADQTKHENTDKLKHEDAQKQKLEHEAKIAAQNEMLAKLEDIDKKIKDLNARLAQRDEEKRSNNIALLQMMSGRLSKDAPRLVHEGGKRNRYSGSSGELQEIKDLQEARYKLITEKLQEIETAQEARYNKITNKLQDIEAAKQNHQPTANTAPSQGDSAAETAQTAPTNTIDEAQDQTPPQPTSEDRPQSIDFNLYRDSIGEDGIDFFTSSELAPGVDTNTKFASWWYELSDEQKQVARNLAHTPEPADGAGRAIRRYIRFLESNGY